MNQSFFSRCNDDFVGAENIRQLQSELHEISNSALNFFFHSLHLQFLDVDKSNDAERFIRDVRLTLVDYLVGGGCVAGGSDRDTCTDIILSLTGITNSARAENEASQSLFVEVGQMAAIAAIHEAAHVASYWRFDGVGALVKSSRDFRDSKFESLREIAAQWMTERFLAQQTQTAWQKCHDKFCRIYQAPENTLDWKAECYYLWRLFENISETDLDRWRAIESWLILDDGSLSDLMASLQKPDLKPACVKFV